jgi:DNA-binding transcriptional ArsR family regulator
MVEYAVLDAAFAALSDPTRRDILARLTSGDANVGQLADRYEMSLNAVSKHLMALERAGLIRREIVGREHRLSLDPRPLRAASEWLDLYREFWEGRLDALEMFLAKRKKGATRGRKKRSRDQKKN